MQRTGVHTGGSGEGVRNQAEHHVPETQQQEADDFAGSRGDYQSAEDSHDGIRDVFLPRWEETGEGKEKEKPGEAGLGEGIEA